jgi:cobaltochelatase CobS
MTSPAPKVEDLVKKALKEALDKRKTAESVLPVTMKEEETTEDCGVETTVSARVELKDSQRWLSEVIGTPHVIKSEDFPVTVFDDSDWDARISSFIPTINKSYVIDTELASNILRAWELNEKVLCYGPTGAGKSSLIEQLCALTRRPFVRVNCTGDMDSSMIFGQLTAKDGSTHWVDGAVTEAVRYGAVFAWDEWDVTPPEISMGLQWLLEDDGKLFLKEMPGSTSDKQIVPHRDFRIVAIGNTQGQGDETGAHAGTNVQNSATLDRFGTAVYIDYLRPDIEETMLKNKFSGINAKAVKELVKLANLVRTGYKANQFSLTMSPRSLFSICRKVQSGCTLKQSFALVYLNKLNDTQRKVADELYTKVYGKNA